MNDESTLRQKARAAIQSGKLPGRRPERMWGGKGSGAECAICGHPVKPDEVEFELQFPTNGAGPGLGAWRAHVRCFAAWEFEREDFLRAASHGDTIADREHDSTARQGSV